MSLAKLLNGAIGLILLVLFGGFLLRELAADIRTRRSRRLIACTESLRISYDNRESPAWERVLSEPELGALGAKLRSIGE